MSERRRIAIFGGTFDPPHLAHTELLKQLQERLRFDKIWVVPAKYSPSKHPVAPYEKRLQWCQEVFHLPGFEVSDLEASASQTLFGRDIYAGLRLKEPSALYSWILGEDQFDQLMYWKAIDEYASDLEWVVLPRGASRRPSGLLSKRLLKSSLRYRWAEGLPDHSEISSSRIRESFLENDDMAFRSWIPKSLWDEVAELYRSSLNINRSHKGD